MKITIDRIENDRFVIELPDGQVLDVPRALFSDASEGDIYRIEKDEVETEVCCKRIQAKMNRLFKDKKCKTEGIEE